MRAIEVEDHQKDHRDQRGREQRHEHAAIVRREQHAQHAQAECGVGSGPNDRFLDRTGVPG